jgi:DNA-binding winged helix-turn-helix (wHTH) protein/tetratricopeptide (TPR) repeat protein
MPHSNDLCYQFGPYQLDVSNRILTRHGETIPLTPKATEILIMLVKNAGQVVEKDELLTSIWADTFVEEANLTQNIFLLRRALGDERSGPKYIETVARRGYRFVGPVRVFDPSEPQNGSSVIGASVEPVVAVLPFLNSTGDPDLEYLADGLTDNIINNLSRVSKLRVMSRSAVLRYRSKEVDPRRSGRELGANAVLVGTISARKSGLTIGVELVDVRTGWQLWGESCDSENKDLLEIQEVITRQLLVNLKLKLSYEEEKRITARCTENASAYQSYLEGRYHWNRYTRMGIEKAINHFRHAIELDPNYALSYAAIVDCYLRLATNYLPPEDDTSNSRVEEIQQYQESIKDESDWRVKVRFEWDLKSAERELRRANDLKTNYPAAHQWYFAYRYCKELYQKSHFIGRHQNKPANSNRFTLGEPVPPQIGSVELTPTEHLQVCCAIVREQIDAGNYEAGCKLLQPWWSFGDRPKLDRLNQQSCADLLFTAGELAGFVASSVNLPRGQRHAEELLNGAIAFFEQLGLTKRAAEGRIALALCYHRQGLFDVGLTTVLRAFSDLSEEDLELRSLALMRLGGLERNAGRLKDALVRLIQAVEIAESCGTWITARCDLELASIHKDLAVSEDTALHFDQAMCFYLKALHQFEAVGHHRYIAIVENNIGLLLLDHSSYADAEKHLLRARKFFETLSDTFRGAQLNETLSRLYIGTEEYERAQELIWQAIRALEHTDAEAILAETLTTSGIVSSRLGRFSEAKRSFEGAYQISERCSDNEGAGLALLTMLEELDGRLDHSEKIQVAEMLRNLLATTQQRSLQARVERSMAKITSSTERDNNAP